MKKKKNARQHQHDAASQRGSQLTLTLATASSPSWFHNKTPNGEPVSWWEEPLSGSYPARNKSVFRSMKSQYFPVDVKQAETREVETKVLLLGVNNFAVKDGL